MSYSVFPGLNGFEGGQDATTLTFDEDPAERTVTITPIGRTKVFLAGSPMYFSTSRQVTWPDITGLYAIFFNPENNDVLQIESVFAIGEEIVLRNALVAVVYWNADQQKAVLLGDERHGLMDSFAHAHFHSSLGSQIQRDSTEGTFKFLGAQNTGPGGDDDLHAGIAMQPGTIRDEDVILKSSTTTQVFGTPGAGVLDQVLVPMELPVLYRVGPDPGVWWVQNNPAPVLNISKLETEQGYLTNGGQRHPINTLVSGSWQLTNVTHMDYFITHLFAWNDVRTRVCAIIGNISYASISPARDFISRELRQIEFGGLPFPEFKALHSLILQTANGFNNSFASRCSAVDSSGDPGIMTYDWRDSTL